MKSLTNTIFLLEAKQQTMAKILLDMMSFKKATKFLKDLFKFLYAE